MAAGMPRTRQFATACGERCSCAATRAQPPSASISAAGVMALPAGADAHCALAALLRHAGLAAAGGGAPWT
jgi:hypothetical protein